MRNLFFFSSAAIVIVQTSAFLPLQAIGRSPSALRNASTQTKLSLMGFFDKKNEGGGLSLTSEAEAVPLADIVEFTGLTVGLAQALKQNASVHKLTIWVVDDSGSMMQKDGHRMLEMKDGSFNMVECTRWRELTETVKYHAGLAGLLKGPTSFQLLNQAAEYPTMSVAWDAVDTASVTNDATNVVTVIQTAMPRGATPLAEKTRDLAKKVQQMKGSVLARSGAKVVVVIATDGLPTMEGLSSEHARQDFVQSLRSFQNLPVWLVVRLCTDEKDVVDFYNTLDEQLEFLDVDVLDDFVAEAQEIHACNPWLNYAQPLHRLRERGMNNRLFDLLDERLLTKDELMDFCQLLFGTSGSEPSAALPDPNADWSSFLKTVEDLQEDETTPWNPVTRKRESWVNVDKLKMVYKGK